MPLAEFRESRGSAKPWIGLGIDIITDCNLRCRQCFFEKGPPSLTMMSLEQINFIVNLAAGKFSEIYILGGEPTLHPQLRQILIVCLEKMDEVILVTNGLKLAQEDFCQSIALPKLKIAMHRWAMKTSAQKLVDHLAQKENTFLLDQKAWKNVEKYWQGAVCVQANILKPLVTDGHILDVFKWARKKNYEPVIELTKPGPIFKRGHKLDVTADEIKQLYDCMREYDQSYYPQKIKKTSAIVPPSYGHRCTLVETSLHVRVDGTIVPCVSHVALPLGNIFQDDLEKMLCSPIRLAIQNYRTWIVGPCRQCRLFEFCHGGCRGEAFWDTGCPRASDPYCWHLPKDLSPQDLVPKTCSGCILEKNPGCQIKNW